MKNASSSSLQPSDSCFGCLMRRQTEPTSPVPTIRGITQHLSRNAVLSLLALIVSIATAASSMAATATWIETGGMGNPRSSHTATLLQNGRVLVAGGSGNTGPVSRAELYDPTSGTWTNTGTMRTPRYSHSATLLQNGKVLVVGGYTGGTPVPASTELYDPATGTWTATGAMPSGCGTDHTATLLQNGKVLITGGNSFYYAGSYGGHLGSALLYDPTAGTWSYTGGMSVGRSSHTATLLQNGKVLIAGGHHYMNDIPPYTGYEVYLSSAELYDPATGVCMPTGGMGSMRYGHKATLLPNGKVLIAGGVNSAGVLSSAELYDPVTGTWTATGAMGSGHIGHTATSLNAGKVLIAGGECGNYLASAELYDPACGAWTATGAMVYARAGHTATLLQDGKALLVGGANNSGLLGSAELNIAFMIAFNASAHGDITGFTGPYEFGATAIITATPSLGYALTGWTGDAIGTANPLSLAMDGNKTIGATFAPDLSDVDADGLTAIDELVTYGTDPTKSDTDGDGLSDGQEVNVFHTNPHLADSDGDGLTDAQEVNVCLTNALLADTDRDGLTDGQEVNLTHTNPLQADSNGNGINDAQEDSDGDGLSNLAEITQYGTDPLKSDTDGDGINDGDEAHYAGSFYKLVQGSFTYPQAVADAIARHGRVASLPNSGDYSRMVAKARQSTQGCLWIGLSDDASEGTWVWTDGSTAANSSWLAGQPDGGAGENHVVIMESSSQWADAAENYVAAGYIFEHVGLDPLAPDTDADGLTDGQELSTTHSNPMLDDTDGDGLLDGAEVNTHGSSPILEDTDGDGLNDRVEVEVYHSNPALKDTDGDGFDDLFEVNTGFNPALASSTPDALSTIRTAVEFRFNAANGVSYRIEASADLNQWDVIEAAIIGQSAVVTRFYSTENQPQRYFRARRN